MYTNNIRIDVDIIEVKGADGKIRLVYPEIKIDVDVDTDYDINKLKIFKKGLQEFISVNLSNALKKDKNIW